MGAAGPARQLGVRSVLVALLLSISRRKVAHLASAHEICSELSIPEQIALGFLRSGDDGLSEATYRQFAHTFAEMVKVMDESPVPSFRGVAEAERAAHLAERRRGAPAGAADLLRSVVEGLLEASIPESERERGEIAVDWTDHETWARPKEADSPVPSADPDASWGHAKRNAPGAKDCGFFGYYAQVAVLAPAEGSTAPSPELIRRVVLKSPRHEPASEMAALLEAMAGGGIPIAEVLYDSGYSFKIGFGQRLRALGAELVMDLHPFDRGPKGDFEGAVCLNGNLYCPAVPERLVELGPLERGASAERTALHDRASQALDAYRFARHAGPDGDGYERVMCPAAAGRIRCPLVESSLHLGFAHPTVADAPQRPPRCCSQKTLTVPPEINVKTRQKHPYPSAAHRSSYARRTTAERAYARLCDPAGEGIRRGWCRLFGEAKNTLMYALAAVAHNVRILLAAEKAARSGRRPRMRRRRHQPPVHTAEPSSPGEPAPG